MFVGLFHSNMRLHQSSIIVLLFQLSFFFLNKLIRLPGLTLDYSSNVELVAAGRLHHIRFVLVFFGFVKFLDVSPQTRSKPLFTTDQPLGAGVGRDPELSPLWEPPPVGGAATLDSRTASRGTS